MKVSDFNLLKKFMAMTRSDADAEALMAVRKANEILERSGTSWEGVFARLVTLDVEDAPAGGGRAAESKASADARTEELLDHAERTATGSFVDFVSSLREQWDERGWLSPAQVEALERTRARDERAGGRR